MAYEKHCICYCLTQDFLLLFISKYEIEWFCNVTVKDGEKRLVSSVFLCAADSGDTFSYCINNTKRKSSMHVAM